MSRHITFLDFQKYSGPSVPNSSLDSYRDSNGNFVPCRHASRIPDTPAWLVLTFHPSHSSTGKKLVFNLLQTLNSAWESRRCSVDLASPSRSVTSFALTISIRRLLLTIPANGSRRRISPIGYLV